MTDSAPLARAYAYHVPLNPYDPHQGEWATLVRRERVRAGDRIDVSVHETLPNSGGSSPEVVVRASPHEWEVIAVEHADDDGRIGGVRGVRGPNPIWDGVLVLQQVE